MCFYKECPMDTFATMDANAVSVVFWELMTYYCPRKSGSDIDEISSQILGFNKIIQCVLKIVRHLRTSNVVT